MDGIHSSSKKQHNNREADVTVHLSIIVLSLFFESVSV